MQSEFQKNFQEIQADPDNKSSSARINIMVKQQDELPKKK